MAIAAEHTSVSVVLIGQFEPSDFMPQKLAEGKAITASAANSASFVTLIPNQAVQFKFDWGELLVNTNRFQISSDEAPYIRVCDFALKVLRDIAPHSLVAQFGINVDCHYDLQSADNRNAFGTRLAPPQAWGKWGDAIMATMNGDTKGGPLQGGVINLQMRHPFLEGGVTGWRDVSVRPSNKIETNTGIWLKTNHHHQVTPIEATFEELANQPLSDEVTTLLLTTLSNGFENSIDDAVSIFEEAIGL